MATKKDGMKTRGKKCEKSKDMDTDRSSGDDGDSAETTRKHVVPSRKAVGSLMAENCEDNDNLASTSAGRGQGQGHDGDLEKSIADRILQQVLSRLDGRLNRDNGGEPDDVNDDEVSEEGSRAGELRDFLGAGADNGQGQDDFELFEETLGSNEAVGPELVVTLAKVLQRMLRERLPEDKAKEVWEGVVPPGNVPLLTMPRINACLWGVLPRNTRGSDIHWQKVQTKLTATMTTLANLCSDLHKVKYALRDPVDQALMTPVIQNALKCFQQGAVTFHDCSQRRRDIVRNDIGQEFKSLCNAPSEEDDTLFGRDLEDKVKDLSQAKFLGNKVASKKKGDFLGPRSQPQQPARGRGTTFQPRGAYNQANLYQGNYYRGQSNFNPNFRGGGFYANRQQPYQQSYQQQYQQRGRGRVQPKQSKQ